MIKDTDGNRQLSSTVDVEQGTTEEGSFTVDCNTGYVISIPTVDDVTCEFKHSAAGSWTGEGGQISLSPWNGTTQTFNYRIAADASAIYKERLLPLQVRKSTVTTDFTFNLESALLSLSGQNLTLTNRREILTLGELLIAGQDVTFTNRRLTIDAGALAVSGQNVDLLFDQPNEDFSIDPGSLTLTGQNVDFPYGRVLGITAGSLTITGQSLTLIDPDAQAFITATGITDTTQKNAIDALVIALKGYGIWTKMHAIYPFVGGTATTHKYNLKDPRDLDAAFRLSFLGTGWTHDANGAAPNGTSSYADTFFDPVTQSSSTSSFHMSFYKAAAPANGTSRLYMGCIDGDSNPSTFNNHTTLGFFTAGTLERGGIAAAANNDTQTSPTAATSSAGTAGMTCVSVNGSRVEEFYLNGSAVGTPNTATGSFTNTSIYLGALHNDFSGATFFFNQYSRFASIGTGLSSTEAGNLFTACEAFQDALSRGVI